MKINFRISVLSLTCLAASLTALAAPVPSVESLAALSKSEGLQSIVRVLGNEKSATQFRGFLAKLGISDELIDRAMKDPAAAQRLMIQSLKARQSDVALRTEATRLLGMDSTQTVIKTAKTNAVVVDTKSAKGARGNEELREALGMTAPARASIISPENRQRAARFAAKVAEMSKAGRLDPLDSAAFSLAMTNHPDRIATLVGEGFFGKCGKMGIEAPKNYLRTLVAAANEATDLAEADALATSLMTSTETSKAEARDSICYLTQHCNLYLAEGPASLNCR